MDLKKAPINTPIPLYYVGPDLSSGPLPTIFYFALSASDSLLQDPFNQPVVHLQQFPVRIFSVDLPCHDTVLPTEALAHWAKMIESGQDLLGEFLDSLTTSLKTLLTIPELAQSPQGVFGLSRGGFIAAHIAARIPSLTTLLTFAPLTDLGKCKEFAHLSTLLDKHSLRHLTPILSKKTIRTHIGGRDTRVDTNSCYHWIHSLIESAFAEGIRSAPIELFIKPSIGYQGHGTSQQSFVEGASWLLNQLTKVR